MYLNDKNNGKTVKIEVDEHDVLINEIRLDRKWCG